MITEINDGMGKVRQVNSCKIKYCQTIYKQDHKSKLMTEKYLLLPLNPQQLTPVQTAIQRVSEIHPDFEIEPVSTI